MTAPKRRKPSEKKFAAAYWEVYRGVLGKESSGTQRKHLSRYLDDLVKEGVLHAECDKIFRKDKTTTALGDKMRLHRHQEEAAREEEESPHSGPTKRLRR